MSGVLPLALLGLAEAKGLDRERVAREVSLPPTPSPEERVPLSRVLGLWRLLVLRFPSDHLGLELATRWRVESLGLLGYLAAHAATLGEALDRLVAYQAIVDGESRLSYAVRGEVLVVSLARDAALSALRQPVEAMLASGHAFFELLSASTLTARRVRMSHASSLAPGPYRAFFGVPVEHGARVDELHYDRAILDRPIPRADPQLGAYLLELAEASTARVRGALDASAAALSDRVSRELRRRLATEEPLGLEAIAKALGTSERALQRGLSREGTRFRALLDAERRRVAELLLASPHAHVSDVARSLGFAEIASFSRAFKRWTRRSPVAYRRALG